MSGPNFLTITQIAERIGVPRPTVYGWRRRGIFDVAVYQPPGSTLARYKATEVDAWWNAQRKERA